MTKLLELLQARLVVSLALNETVALLGFVLAFPRPARLVERVRVLVPQLAALALLLALAVACSFRGGDFTPMAKEPETSCSREAAEICKEKLGSADIGNCIAREKYRCELLEQEQAKDPAKPAP